MYYFGDAWLRGAYMNNPHVLVRFDLDPGSHVFTLVVSQYERWRDVYYTLEALSTAPTQLTSVPERFPNRVQAMAEWTRDSAGGHSGRRGFFDNPQLSVELQADSDLFVSLRAHPKLSVNIRLYASGGERVFGSGTVELVSSGDYRSGFCFFIN
jgi:calpain-7